MLEFVSGLVEAGTFYLLPCLVDHEEVEDENSLPRFDPSLHLDHLLINPSYPPQNLPIVHPGLQSIDRNVRVNRRFWNQEYRLLIHLFRVHHLRLLRLVASEVLRFLKHLLFLLLFLPYRALLLRYEPLVDVVNKGDGSSQYVLVAPFDNLKSTDFPTSLHSYAGCPRPKYLSSTLTREYWETFYLSLEASRSALM